MAGISLRLFSDAIAAGAEANFSAGPNRILYVVAGSALVSAGAAASLAADSAWHGRGALSVRGGASGARILRFELGGAAGEPALLEKALTLDDTPKLMRCDRVAFPPGGVAYTHTHQGPGIRCVMEGRIRIDAAGASHEYGPGEPWFESGPDPVFAAGSATVPTAFIRVMVLPREYLGRSSIRYMKPEDQDKPKRQSYRIYIDQPIEIAGN
jgi:hypothetical protein